LARACIRDAEVSRFGRRKEGAFELIEEALKDISLSGVDLILVGSMSLSGGKNGGNLASRISDAIGLSHIPSIQIDTASSTGAALIHCAARAVSSQDCDRALVVAVDHLSEMASPQATAMMSSVLSEYETRLGCTMHSLAAMTWNIYARRYGADWRALYSVSSKNHRNGYLNPKAHLRKRITEEEYTSSRYISYPLHLYDCAPVSDGAAVAVLERKGDVRIIGIGHGTDTISLSDRKEMDTFGSTRRAAVSAYSMAGIAPEEVDFAELHDAFTPLEIISSEDTGIFMKGSGAENALEGNTALDGKIPLNPSGGLKARGHPVSVSGLAQIVECFRQLSHRAGALQIDGRTGLAQSTGGFGSNNFVTILKEVKK